MKRKFFILIAFSLCTILFNACDMFDSAPKEFLQDYASIAYINGAYGNGTWIEKNGWINISPKGLYENYVVTLSIENPGNYELSCDVSLPEGCTAQILSYICAPNFISITYANDTLESIDGDLSRNNISPTIKLFRKADGRPQSVYTLYMRCNSPPEQIPFALSQMIQENNEQLIIAFDLPKISSDVKTLTVNANGVSHTYNVNADGSLSAAAGESWPISQNAPENIGPTFLPNGPLFKDYSHSNWDENCTPYYITTNITNIRNIDVFYIDFILTDEGGLTSQYTIPSRVIKIDPPYSSSDGVRYLNQDDGEDYATFTIYPPKGHDDATVEYEVVSLYEIVDPYYGTIEMQEGSSIYGMEHPPATEGYYGSTPTGKVTFQLYPNYDGSAAHYKVKYAVSNTPGYWTSDNSASNMGEDGIITVTGRPYNVTVTSNDNIFSVDAGETVEYIITASDENAEINYMIWRVDIPVASGTEKGPIKLMLSEGTYSVYAQVNKPYHQVPSPLNETVTVTSSAMYISSSTDTKHPGSDTTGDGTINAPFETIAKACQAIYNKDPNLINKTNSEGTPVNFIYVLSDMTTTNDFMDNLYTVPTAPAFILCGCKNGVKGAEVSLYCNNIMAPSFSVSGSYKVLAQNIKFTSTGVNNSPPINISGGYFMLKDSSVTGIKGSNGAVYVSAGAEFRIKGKVTITGNTKIDGTTPCNLYLNTGAHILFATEIDITGTVIGITLDDAHYPISIGVPSSEFTLGYKYVVNAPAPGTYFISDKPGYSVGWDSTKNNAALIMGGGSGSITPPTPPANITFSLSSANGNGNNISVSASSGGSTITSDITSWSIELWQGTVKTPTTFTSNSITIPSTYAAGSYIIKVKAVYKGSTYSGELLYTKT